MRRILLAFLWGGLLLQSAAAQSDASLSQPTAQVMSDAEAGDPYAQWQLATFYKNRAQAGDLETSLGLFTKSLAGYRAREGISGASAPIVLNDIAATQTALGRPADAIATYVQRVGVLSLASPGSIDLGSAMTDLGRAYQAASQHSQAIAQFTAARGVYKAVSGDVTASMASLWLDEGISWYYLKDYDKTLAAYDEAVKRYRAAPDAAPADFAIALSNVAGLYFELGRHAEAEAPRKEQIAVLRASVPDSVTYALALRDLTQTYQAVARHAEAMPLIEEAQRIFAARSGDTTNDLADMFALAGISQEGLNRFDQAAQSYSTALQHYEAATGKETEAVAISLSNLARVRNTLAQYAAAENALKRSIDIYRKIKPDSDNLAYALQELAISDQKISKYRESIPLIEQARVIFLKNHDDMSSLVGDTYLNQGISEEGLKNFSAALNTYAEAIRRYEASDGKNKITVGYAINNIAWVYRRMERYAESEASFRKALPILETALGPTHFNTTKVYINIGIVSQLQGKNDEAIRWSMKALTNLNKNLTTTLDDQRWTYDTLAKAFKGRNDPKRAILFAKLAINAQQKIRSNNKEFKAEDLKEFKAEWQFLYQDLADLLIGEGRLAEAQAVLNMEKEEELIDFVQRDSTADVRDSEAALTPKEDAELGDVDKLLSQPIAAANAVAALIEKKNAGGLSPDEQARLDTLQGSLDQAYTGFMDDVDAFLATADKEDVGVQKEIDAINLDYTADTQEELRVFNGKAAMLQIASLGEATHIFLTVPDASVHREVKIARADLSRMVFEALDAIERRDPKTNDKMQALYHLLIEPVAPDLKASGAETLMLNLQGFLRYVPFAALYDGKHYLIEDYALSIYTPAAKTEFAAGDRNPGKSAGFGVTASHPGFAPLPGVARELEAIFGDPGKPGALSGAASLDGKFTRDSFREALQGRPEIVHIASHFKLVPGRETDSFLLLGDGSPLSLSDIRKGRGFRFGGVDLLTLSACETARGGGGEGDEVESFGALAQMNGASSVMATLWPVADEATAAIMQSFYMHMVEGKMSKADALRAAQIEAIRGMQTGTFVERGAASLVATAGAKPNASAPASHPYFWSPFVLMGNWM